MNSVHLVRRFVASVVARPLSEVEREWVAAILTGDEMALWLRQPRYDQRHALGVARRVEVTLGTGCDPAWLAAALVHDVGKIDSGLGIMGRVVATLAMIALGRGRVREWSTAKGLRGRFGRYAEHGPIGARLLRDVGGRPLPARWAEVHHLGKSHQGWHEPMLPAEVVHVLSESDRD